MESGLTIIERELGHLKPAQVSADRIARLMRDLEAQGLKPGTIKRYLSPLSMILNLAVRRGAVSVNTMTLLSPEERPRDDAPRKAHEWTQTELRRLLQEAQDLDDRPEARQRYFPLVALLVYTGARIGEALALRWGDVDFLAGTIEIKHSLSRTRELTPPKTRAGERVVAMPESLLRTLLGHKPEHAADGDFVFAARQGRGPLSYWSARDRGIVPALERAGLAGVRIHDLRHACASLLISRGLSPVEVAAQLGHANSSVTLQVYSHMFDRSLAHDRVREALDVLSPEAAT